MDSLNTQNTIHSDKTDNTKIYDERPKVNRRITRKKLAYIEPLDEPGTIYNAEVHQSAQRLLKVHRITKYVKFCKCCCLPQETPSVVVPFNFCDRQLDFGLGIFLYFYYIKFCLLMSFICIGLSSVSTIVFTQEYTSDIENYCNKIINNNTNSTDYINRVDNFIELHQKMIDEMKKNSKSIEPIVTLRNLKYCCYLNKNSIPPRIAAEISYTARFPKDEKKDFEKILEKLGDFEIDKKLNSEIERGLNDNFIYYNESYKKAAYLALIAIKEGLHPLLIGEKGSGNCINI